MVPLQYYLINWSCFSFTFNKNKTNLKVLTKLFYETVKPKNPLMTF